MSNMAIFERREQILSMLREQETVRVGDLAQVLDVSEGTVRNDLTALEEEQRLVRVRGGARLRSNNVAHNAQFAQRVRHNATAKQRIARWAANEVEDGEAILLDASTTVYHMAPFLQQRRNLTIVTTSIELARRLSANAEHTVILLGGVMRPDGALLGGSLGARLLNDLHVSKAFLSCAGLSPRAGLTDVDIAVAELKRHIVQTARTVLVLVDSTKIGKASLSTFARLSDVDQIVTDNGIADEDVETIRENGVTLVVCGETTASSYTPYSEESAPSRHYTIGFANLSDDIPFAMEVRRGLERAAQAAGNVDLVLADNKLDGKVAMHVAERLIGKGIDLAIEYQIDEGVGNRLMARFREANIPVIAVDIPMVGASFFGADNYRTGHAAGAALGKWIGVQWRGEVDAVIVLEEPRAGAQPGARIQGQLDGIQEVLGPLPEKFFTYLDGGNTRGISAERAREALAQRPGAQHIAILCFNDDNALGALDAARRLGREEDVAIVGQGADSSLRPEIRRRNSRIIGSTSFMPEQYGDALVEMALKILRGEPVPPADYIDHVFINADNIDLFYPESD